MLCVCVWWGGGGGKGEILLIGREIKNNRLESV